LNDKSSNKYIYFGTKYVKEYYAIERNIIMILSQISDVLIPPTTTPQPRPVPPEQPPLPDEPLPFPEEPVPGEPTKPNPVPPPPIPLQA
jgi:hypothetical protein